jgi:hypothetical protein
MLVSSPASSEDEPLFDHDQTRYPLTGAHRRVPCAICHRGGQFVGTPRRCDLCHTGTSGRAETRPTSEHIPVYVQCQNCHMTRRWEPARMDHGVVDNRCIDCHIGRIATSKPADHIPSSNDCGGCHNTSTWSGASFDHDDVVGSCFSCHDGSTATGKNPGHIASSNQCELCHSTRRWIPAGFDHSGVSPGTCNTCHDGNQATGTPRGHFMTSLPCDECHTTQGWLPARFDHTGTGYPGDHRVGLDCRDCHGGNSALVTWTSPAYQPDCAGCHENDYRPGVDRHRGSVSLDRDCGSSGCHSVRDRNWD